MCLMKYLDKRRQKSPIAFESLLKVVFWLSLIIVTSLLLVNQMLISTSRKSVQPKYRTLADERLIEEFGAKDVYDHLNEVINEEEALQYRPCNDPKLAADVTFSTLKVLGSRNKVYDIGDKIFAQATLFDSYGRQKTTGGDNVRARIYNKALEAYGPGTVYDHKNGTYTLIFEALWSGESNISATIAYTREAITAQYRLTSTLLSLRPMMAKYKAQQYEEDAFCHMDNSHLLATTNHTDVCNFTALNSGMPWYCGKPQNPKLKCTDWRLGKCFLVSTKDLKSLTYCERSLLSQRYHKVLTKTVAVSVKEQARNSRHQTVRYHRQSTSCFKYNTTELWYQKYTTGFFLKHQWKLRHCQGFHHANFQSCFRNKTLYLIGDSTTRQWYLDIKKRYHCEQLTEKWTKPKWLKTSRCKVASNNFTVTMAIHSQPFHQEMFWLDPKVTFISITKRLEWIKTNEHAIVLIHIFSHMSRTYPKCFKNKMQAIRVGVEKFLKRNDKAKVFIKMPHTHTNIDGRNNAINDFYGSVFSRIIIETFHGLYDKVVALDNKDATISVASRDMHPPGYIVSSMVDRMLSYVCE